MTDYTNSNGVLFTVTGTGTGMSPYKVAVTHLDRTADNLSIVSGVNGIVSLPPGSTQTVTLLGTYVDLPGTTMTYNIGLVGASTFYIGGTATINSTVSALTGTTVNVDGGSATLGTFVSAISGMTANIEDKGSLTIGTNILSTVTGTTVNFQENGGTLVLSGSPGFLNITGLGINGFKVNQVDYIEDAAISYASVSSYKVTTGLTGLTQTIDFRSSSNADLGSVLINGTALRTGTFSASSTSGALTLSSVGGALEFTPNVCFMAGTRIKTIDGETAVEVLKPGDLIATRNSNETVYLPVHWVGRRRLDLMAHPRPETAAPICIDRGAFAENVPQRDLFVSPDHAIFVDGRFICARQLVNGMTIRRQTGLASVEYFHIELEQHAIILAEGLETESYLDTGNRGFFSNSDKPTQLHPDLSDKAGHPTRQVASCAPFVWDEESVKPVWTQLSERAAMLGFPAPESDVTTDPMIRVMVSGRMLRPVSSAHGVHRFVVPDGATDVRLLSRSGSPTDAAPWLEDQRRLGVYVERITVRGAGNSDVLDISVDSPSLSQGWWAVEGEGPDLRRWTDGEAVLPLPLMDGPLVLEVQASSSGLAYLAGELSHAA